MKRILLFVAVFAATVATALAEPADGQNLFKKHYDYRNFTAVSVSSIFRVELTFEDTWSVDVEVPDFLQPYLKISCTGEKLRIGLETLPKDIQRKLNDNPDKARAWVSMPRLLSLTMSGATHVNTVGTPKLAAGDNLSIDLSGASELETLQAASEGRLSIELSGASKANLTTSFQSMNIDLSGASHLKLDGDTDDMELDCSGASSARFTGEYGKVNSDVSGASKVKVTGNVGTLKVDASGSSKCEVDGVTDKADLELSGVSKCKLAVTKKLSYELSGVSTLQVKDLGATIRGESNRGSKIEYLK